MDKKQQTVDTYNRSAAAMAKKFNSIGGRVENVEKVFSYATKENSFVLEIGCGNGRDAAEILKKTNHYLGIDISEEMVKLAKEQTPAGEFEVADIETYKFPKDVDIIFSFASLLHSNKESVKRVFEEVYTAISPGGLFFVSLKNAPYQEKAQTDEFGTRTFYYYTIEDLKDLAGEKFKVLWQDEPIHGKQKWADVLFQKRDQ
ncbi:MAG TPA: class I SAM-dependent methyltransferase [Candidatus Paceibacterota bacterium]